MRINSLAISGLLGMDLHSLNNEGAEGNHLLTRQVFITDGKGSITAVNAVSGDMFKHIQAEHLYQIALEEKLPLCGGCRRFDANRICADTSFMQSFKEGVGNADIIDATLQRCILDDAEGILITSQVGGKNRAIPRKSVVELGWVVGRPESTRTENYFHVKYAPEERGKGAGEGSNLGQNIFHRPASSGLYAVVANVDLYRLGQNDITLDYPLDQEDRNARAQALLQSIMFTFLKPTGAHRNTQSPHMTDFNGVITVSSSSYPAPVASALNKEYEHQVFSLVDTLNRMKPESVKAFGFSSLAGFAEVMEELVKSVEPARVGC